jgi:hypothetical protein
MYGDIDQLTRSSRELVIRITEVNTTTNIIWGNGAANKRYQVSIDGWSPLLAIPQIGERWVIVGNLDYGWRLARRLEDGSEAFSLETLRPGDRRLEANGLYISTKKGTLADTQITLMNQLDYKIRPEGVTLFCQDDELRVVLPDGTVWKVALEPLE